MEMKLKFLFLFILLLSFTFASCPAAQRELEVPAITEVGHAELVRIGIETRPGKGEIFVSAQPAIGYYTQLSEQIARDVAFALTNTSACDVYLRIFAPAEISHVDGPSGGAAMALLILAALRGEQLRHDFSITGTIERDGTIGPVGGVVAKAEAVAKAGRALFLIPRSSYEDKLGVTVVEKIYKITIGEVEKITEAYAIATRRSEAKKVSFEREEAIAYEKSKINHTNTSYFAQIAQRMVEQIEAEAATSVLPEHFSSRAQNARRALAAGHLYTAANGAFVIKIDIEYVNFSDENYALQKSATKKCIANYTPKKITHENFEFDGAADLRWVWAKEKLKEIEREEEKIKGIAAKLELYRELLSARYWCEAAHAMKAIGGREVSDETNEKIKAIASEIVNDALLLAAGKADKYIQSHLATAKEALNSKMYIAAIIDAAYVTSTVRAAEEIIAEREPQFYTYLWPQLYADHASTIEDERSAARLYALAEDIEHSLSAIKAILVEEMKEEVKAIEIINVTNITNATNITNITIPTEPTEKIYGATTFEVVAIIILSVIIIALILKRRE